MNFNELVLSEGVLKKLPEMLEEMFKKAYRAASYFMLVLDEDGDKGRKAQNTRKEGEGVNDYKVTFKRSNGTIGTAIFTVATRGEAGDAFRDCYRHDVYAIISIELMSETEKPQLAHRG